ncbi:MFS transporter [Tepidibacter mesophilus]|uniref:MFS transporter n=1 Tax=Tepidibacter mesophilus TaxID=655607 RepID=UPI000C07143A|nr:MFS transporter [Tepidibacter mesophilus]
MKKINSKIKRFWGISEVGFSFMSTVETAFFMIFLTDVAKLPLVMSAAIASVSGIADAVTTMLAGVIIDKVNFKSGKYRPWLIYCPPVVVVFFILMFTKIGGDATAALICGSGYIISHGVWNICWTANRALVGALTDDAEERAFLSARLSSGSSAGKIIASYFVPVLSVFFLGLFSSSNSEVVGYTMTVLVAALTFSICYVIHFIITKGYDEPLTEEEKSTALSSANMISFGDMLRGVASNPQLILVLIYDFLKLIAYYTIVASIAYYAKVVLGAPNSMSFILVVFNMATLIGTLFSQKTVKKLGSKNTNFVGMIGFIVCHGICYILPNSTFTFLVLLGLGQVFFGIAYGNTTSLYSMCGTYSEHKTGKNTKGVIMSFCSLAIKISIAVRGVVITSVLGFINYSPDLAITASTQNGIKTLFFLVPIAFLASSLIPLIWFKIKDSDIAIMEREIAQRAKNINV